MSRNATILGLSALLGPIAGGLGPTPVLAAAPQVTVGAHYTGPFGDTNVELNALPRQDDTATGQFEQHNPDIDLFVHGTIDCLFIVGNQAVVSGTLTMVKTSNPAFSFIMEGSHFLLSVQDSGEGKDAPPDRVSVYFVSSTPLECHTPPFASIPITGGNVQVHP